MSRSLHVGRHLKLVAQPEFYLSDTRRLCSTAARNNLREMDYRTRKSLIKCVLTKKSRQRKEYCIMQPYTHSVGSQAYRCHRKSQISSPPAAGCDGLDGILQDTVSAIRAYPAGQQKAPRDQRGCQTLLVYKFDKSMLTKQCRQAYEGGLGRAGGAATGSSTSASRAEACGIISIGWPSLSTSSLLFA